MQVAAHDDGELHGTGQMKWCSDTRDYGLQKKVLFLSAGVLDNKLDVQM
ncbi:hypothetical protein M989_04618 [Kluyvera georgiana ATCC 51603]|uniref:Uncharacterized protein n=1 Tax=Kluyvera georgiana ATCC 51603 TaxID=1354264 RepID=A0A1B7JAB7_9ENTR|nr:hypothetical protein M989_04618 [Kluyvera georgiana ATCC 51603]